MSAQHEMDLRDRILQLEVEKRQLGAEKRELQEQVLELKRELYDARETILDLQGLSSKYLGERPT